MSGIRRREFILGFQRRGGVAGCDAGAAGRAGAADRLLINLTADDPESGARLAALVKGLQELSWADAAMCGSRPAGAGLTLTAFADTQRN
jgi:hypothetical protein